MIVFVTHPMIIVISLKTRKSLCTQMFPSFISCSTLFRNFWTFSEDVFEHSPDSYGYNATTDNFQPNTDKYAPHLWCLSNHSDLFRDFELFKGSAEVLDSGLNLFKVSY